MLRSRLRMAIGGFLASNNNNNNQQPQPQPNNDKPAWDYSHFKRQYKVGAELGRGGFGTVYQCFRMDGTNWACKFVSRTNITEWAEYENRMIPLEIVLLLKCRGIEGVIQIYEWFEKSDGYMIIMEKPSPCTDLFDYISDRGALKENIARTFFRQVVQTVKECADKGILHRDIKDENLVVDMRTGKLKLVDFGSGAFLKDCNYTDFEGTRVYGPPEWIEKSSYDGIQALVWSLGILLFDMVCGDIPFRKDQEIIRGHLHWRNPITAECKDLIRLCLAKEGAARPTLAELLLHDWMATPSDEEEATPTELCAVRHKLASVPDRLATEPQPRHPRVPLVATRSDHNIPTTSTAALFVGAPTERVPHPEEQPCCSNSQRMFNMMGSPTKRYPKAIVESQLYPSLYIVNVPESDAPAARPQSPTPLMLQYNRLIQESKASLHQRNQSLGLECPPTTSSAHSSGSSSGYGTASTSPPPRGDVPAELADEESKPIQRRY